MSVLVFVFTLVLSGCSIGKKFEEPKKNSDGKDIINIGDGYQNIPPDAQIVIGADGQSYLVDGQGNSYIYNPSSVYAVPDTSSSSSSSSEKPADPVEKPDDPAEPTDKPTESTTESTTEPV